MCLKNNKVTYSYLPILSKTKSFWKWSGCSANVGYAARFTRKFLDVREIEGDARALMNLHNNKVGRKVGSRKNNFIKLKQEVFLKR